MSSAASGGARSSGPSGCLTVTERVEQGSGRVVSAAKLTAKVVLKNSSANQAVRLAAQGQPIKLEETRTEPTLKFAAYGSDRLDTIGVIYAPDGDHEVANSTMATLRSISHAHAYPVDSEHSHG